MKRLPERLKAIASYIDSGASVADIGSDHGYLPVYLALKESGSSERAPRIIASDISAGSLESSKRTAEKYGVCDKITFINAPGLEKISQGDVDTVVIAGIGGENIAGILQDAPWTVSASEAGKLKIILQPQTKLDVLRNFLHYSGYRIAEETSVTDRGREYAILVIGNQ